MSTHLERNSRTTFNQGETRTNVVNASSTNGAKKTTQNVGARTDTTTSGNSTSASSTGGSETTTASGTSSHQVSESSAQSKGDIALTISFRLVLRGGMGNPLPSDYVVDPCS